MKSTLIGLLVALICVLLGAMTHAVSPVFLISNVTALLIVLGGALGATMAGFDMAATKGVFKAIKRAILPPPAADPAKTLTLIVQFARKARHEGLLSLESEITDLDLPFMRKGLQLAIDGSDPDAVAAVLRNDIRTMKARHKVAADWTSSYGIYAPTFGIIGAVIGLIADARPPRQAGRARRWHRLGVRRHVLGRVHRQRRDAAAVRQDEADVDRRGGVEGDDARGRARDPGRAEPTSDRRDAHHLPAAVAGRPAPTGHG